jgi:hypothetical protein
MLPAGDTGARTCDRSGIGIKRPPVGYSAEKASTSGTADAVSTSTNHAAFIISAAEKEKRILRETSLTRSVFKVAVTCVFAFILTSELNFSVIFRLLSLCLVKHVGIKADGLLVAT